MINFPIYKAPDGNSYARVREVAKQLGVATKTVNRWGANKGLPIEKVVLNGEKRQSSVVREEHLRSFLVEHRELVEKAMRFTQISSKEKEDIIATAKEWSGSGSVTERVAAHYSRSVETVRLILKGYNNDNPQQPIVLNGNTQKTKPEGLLKKNIAYMDSQNAFPFLTAEEQTSILAPMPESSRGSRTARGNGNINPEEKDSDLPTVLNAEQEKHQFRKYNFLKYLAHEKLKELRKREGKISKKDMRNLEQMISKAQAVRNDIWMRNTRLVFSVASQQFSKTRFQELVGEGHMALKDAIEKFDESRGARFFGFAKRTIIRRYINTSRKSSNRREMPCDFSDDNLNEDGRCIHSREYNRYQKIQEIIRRALVVLDAREQYILKERFGLSEEGEYVQEPKTMQDIGIVLGITKQRVCQLEARAIEKMKKVVDKNDVEDLEIPDLLLAK